ncbi:hypothetical protein K461DRAFT_282163 [Myriangium duriaei CBS 260.36]|uniref:LYR motif-containing protein 2 n=1 Tax=Myriangium duriaei CBS 260.36 TaxID=1168546 RepID=A0A9P4ITZ5_9PEZI|nr:hypothetical protein K461DRAFT_282163 [Myriangium duriaei CBS 260.36]
MRPLLARFYATIARPSKLRPTLSLEHFVQRQRAIALYRDISRALKKIPPSPTRSEMHHFARTEFEQHRAVTDISHIRYLISTGRTQFDSMKRYVEQI